MIDESSAQSPLYFDYNATTPIAPEGATALIRVGTVVTLTLPIAGIE